MMGFSLDYEAARGVLALRIASDFRDAHVEALRGGMADALALARTHGPLRLLCDNRAGIAFPTGKHELLWDLVAQNGDPADRIAILVANSLAKVQSREKTGDRGMTFASENAAYTWLSVGMSAAA